MANTTKAALALLDQLNDAINNHDGDRAVLVLRCIHTVAGDEFYRHLVDHLLFRGLSRSAATTSN